MPVLVNLLSHESGPVVQQAVQALVNLAGGDHALHPVVCAQVQCHFKSTAEAVPEALRHLTPKVRAARCLACCLGTALPLQLMCNDKLQMLHAACFVRDTEIWNLP